MIRNINILVWSLVVVLVILVVDLQLTKIRSVEIADELLSGLNCLHKGWAQSCLWNEVQKLDVWKYLFRLAWHQTQAWLISKRQGVECATRYPRQYFLNKNNQEHVKHTALIFYAYVNKNDAVTFQMTFTNKIVLKQLSQLVHFQMAHISSK